MSSRWVSSIQDTIHRVLKMVLERGIPQRGMRRGSLMGYLGIMRRCMEDTTETVLMVLERVEVRRRVGIGPWDQAWFAISVVSLVTS